MIILAATLLLAQDSGHAFSGRDDQIRVTVPRSSASAVVDGRLDEPVWATAARLTGFSQYQPVDGRPAEEPTEVLVWYAPDAIWFGVRARELHGDVVRATSANRDNIGSEDQIQVLLDTYNDHRVAFLFGVNPLGVQQDGTRSDQFSGGAGGSSGAGGGVGMNPMDGNVDLNPDYVFESKGRLVPGGYEVEIRIPFRSLRYREGAVQNWGIEVLRRVQHSGFQDSWAPAVRANASFLGQWGTLTGLHDLHRGLVLELTPTSTGHLNGSADAAGHWNYGSSADAGGDLRWGITQNLTLNGTANPDFSQVEADVGQVLLNERFALFYPEKRPFFLDGLERFDVPNQLIYTRRIGDPDGGLKIAGKVAGTDLAALAALDGRSQSATGSEVFAGALRLRRDLGRSSTLGFVGTDRVDGRDYGRLLGLDARIYHSRLYFIELQAVQSWTRRDSTSARGPLLEAVWDRTGRNWGFHYTVRAVSPDFDAAVGFVNRTGVLDFSTFNRLTGYGRRGALVEQYGAFIGFERIFDYAGPSRGPIEGSESISPSAIVHGGWQLNGSLRRAFFSFDSAAYYGYSVAQPASAGPPAIDTVAFATLGTMRDLFGWSLSVTTPTWRLITATASASGGSTPIFSEASRGRQQRYALAVDLRATSHLRLSMQVTELTISRSRDGSRFSNERIPRLKLEYQLTRAIFFRFVGQYTARERDALFDSAGNPILVDTTRTPVRAAPTASNELRMDLLFSYRPTPGTLVYVGYGSTLDEADAFRFRDLRRSADGFFGKVSWLFRL